MDTLKMALSLHFPRDISSKQKARKPPYHKGLRAIGR